MRRFLWVVVLAVATVAVANDFFGIPILGEPKDEINAIIQNLIKGEREKASGHFEHLKTTAPKLARKVKLTDFTIPCADCAAGKNAQCEECEDRSTVVDPHALRYLQYKFESALEENQPVESAWADAIGALNVRKKQVPAREIFQGNILEIGQDAFLMKADDGEIFYLLGCVTDGATIGQYFVGYRWPMPRHSHTYRDETGKPKTAKSYTLNLWWDY
ncbi:MAG: hypothetical protein KJN67_05395 [Pontiella sp.]|nr:hypothetical protein [Pontiella sp.]